jgi:hypothetical protein
VHGKKIERRKHRFALREYSGQAPILRLQQLRLRMTERRRTEKKEIGKRSGFFASLQNDTKIGLHSKITRDSRKGFDGFLFAIVCHAIAKIKFLRLR